MIYHPNPDVNIRVLLRRYQAGEESLESEILNIAYRSGLIPEWKFEMLAILGDSQFSHLTLLTHGMPNEARSRGSELYNVFAQHIAQDTVEFIAVRALIGGAILIQVGHYLPPFAGPGSDTRIAWSLKESPESPSMCSTMYDILQSICEDKGVIVINGSGAFVNPEIERRIRDATYNLVQTYCFQMGPEADQCSRASFALTHIFASFNLMNDVHNCIHHIVRAMENGCVEVVYDWIQDYFKFITMMLRPWLVSTLANPT